MTTLQTWEASVDSLPGHGSDPGYARDVYVE